MYTLVLLIFTMNQKNMRKVLTNTLGTIAVSGSLLAFGYAALENRSHNHFVYQGGEITFECDLPEFKQKSFIYYNHLKYLEMPKESRDLVVNIYRETMQKGCSTLEMRQFMSSANHAQRKSLFSSLFEF